MNTIEGLKKLPSIIQKLLIERDSIQSQIDGCYKPIIDIIKEVFIEQAKWWYINDNDIDMDIEYVRFSFRDRYDDEIVDTHSFPIETFVSADTLRKFIADKEKRKLEAKLAKEAHNLLMAKKALEESERATYLALKKKFEGT